MLVVLESAEEVCDLVALEPDVVVGESEDLRDLTRKVMARRAASARSSLDVSSGCSFAILRMISSVRALMAAALSFWLLSQTIMEVRTM